MHVVIIVADLSRIIFAYHPCMSLSLVSHNIRHYHLRIAYRIIFPYLSITAYLMSLSLVGHNICRHHLCIPPPYHLCIAHRIIFSYLSPPEKLLGGGLSTPVPPFCLFCTIISSKPCILD